MLVLLVLVTALMIGAILLFISLIHDKYSNTIGFSPSVDVYESAKRIIQGEFSINDLDNIAGDKTTLYMMPNTFETLIIHYIATKVRAWRKTGIGDETIMKSVREELSRLLEEGS